MKDIILTEKSVLVLKKNIAVRFEHNYCGGTVILINTSSEDIWYGNKESLKLINELNKRVNPENIITIYSKIISEYPEYDAGLVTESLDTLLNDLYERGFIEIKSKKT